MLVLVRVSRLLTSFWDISTSKTLYNMLIYWFLWLPKWLKCKKNDKAIYIYCLSGKCYSFLMRVWVINTLVMTWVVCNFDLKKLQILFTNLVDACSKSGLLPCSRAVRTKCLRVVANIYSEESACLLYSQIY